MIAVYLHGAAAHSLPGPGPVEIDVLTPAEALTALCAQLPGLRRDLRAGHWRVTCGGESLVAETLTMRIPSRADLHVYPVVEGAGIEIGILGSVLIATAIVTVVGLFLTPSVGDYADRDDAEQQDSYLFDGAVNTAAQGGVVPLILGGPIRIGSTLVSAGITSERIAMHGGDSAPPI